MSFNTIDANIRTPGAYIEVDASQAVQGLSTQTHRVVILGQCKTLDSGYDVAALVLTEANGDTAYGPGYPLADMIRAFKQVNSSAEVWAVPLDDASGAAARVVQHQYTDTVPASGTYPLYIGGVRIPITLAEDDDGDTVAAAVIAAVNAAARCPMTAAAVDGNDNYVDFTAKWSGASGADIDIRWGYYEGELGEPLTVASSEETAGAGTPALATAIANLESQDFDTFILALNDTTSLAALEAELVRRWGGMIQQPAHGFIGHKGTVSASVTLGSARNCPHVTIVANGPIPTATWILAAQVAGRDAAETAGLVNRPRQTLTLPGVMAPARASIPTRTERNTLLYNGISTLTVDPDGTVRIERLISTWQTDTSLLDVTTLRTLAYLRRDLRTFVNAKYPQFKLANDGTRVGPGQPVLTPRLLKAEIVGRARLWEEAALVEDLDQFKADILVYRSQSDTERMEAVLPPDLVNGFRVLAAQIRFLL